MHIRLWIAAFIISTAAWLTVVATTPFPRAIADGDLSFFATAQTDFFTNADICSIAIGGPNDTFLPVGVTITVTATGGFVSSQSEGVGTKTQVTVTVTPAGTGTVGTATVHYKAVQPAGTLTLSASNGLTGFTTIGAPPGCSTSNQCPSQTFSPAAVGGGTAGSTSTTTSTTHGETHTRVTNAPVNEFQTRVLGQLAGVTLFDRTLPNAPSSPEVSAAETEATDALRRSGANVSPPTLVTSSDGRVEVKIGERCNHLETSITTATTIGPATILIGEDQSDTFFVAAGTLNINTNTHTQRFIDDIYGVIVTHISNYAVVGTKVTASPTPHPNVSGQLAGVLARAAAPATPVTIAAAPGASAPSQIRAPNTGDAGLR